MTLSKELEIVIAGTAVVALAGLGAWRFSRRSRRKSPEEIERLRRLKVNACGRIGAGKIVELAEPLAGGPAGPVLLYDYEVAGVTYQAAQDVSSLDKVTAFAPFLPGQFTSVKYDPKQPTNSILACEAWCGIPGLEPAQPTDPEHPEDSARPSVDGG